MLAAKDVKTLFLRSSMLVITDRTVLLLNSFISLDCTSTSAVFHPDLSPFQIEETGAVFHPDLSLFQKNEYIDINLEHSQTLGTPSEHKHRSLEHPIGHPSKHSLLYK